MVLVMGGGKTKFFFFFPQTWELGSQGGKEHGRSWQRNDAFTSQIGKEVRLRWTGGKGWPVRLGVAFSGMATVFSSTEYLHSLTHSLGLSKCTLSEWMNECTGYNAGIRARDWHSVFPQRARSSPRGEQYHSRPGSTELKSELHQQAVWSWTSHLTFLSLDFLFL